MAAVVVLSSWCGGGVDGGGVSGDVGLLLLPMLLLLLLLPLGVVVILVLVAVVVNVGPDVSGVVAGVLLI